MLDVASLGATVFTWEHFGVCLIDHLQVTRVAADTQPQAEQIPPLPTPSALLRHGRRITVDNAELKNGARMLRESFGFSGSGGAYLDFRRDQSVVFTVETSDEGYYEIGLRYGFRPGWMREEQRTVSMVVNGEPRRRLELPRGRMATSQGGPQTLRCEGIWRFRTDYLWLNKGTNTIEFKVDADDSGGVMIDSLLVSPKADSQFIRGMRLEPAAVSIPLHGGTVRLTALFEPVDQPQRAVVWSSTNPDMVAVAPDGLLRGLKPGQTTVVARPVASGPYQATCQVTVDGANANLAVTAKVTASSGKPEALVDGTLESAWAADYRAGDSGHHSGKTKPWVQLSWPQAQKVQRIVIYGTFWKYQDQWQEAYLTDSSGERMPVESIRPGTAEPLEIVFEQPRELTWVKLEIRRSSRLDNGIGEIEIYGK